MSAPPGPSPASSTSADSGSGSDGPALLLGLALTAVLCGTLTIAGLKAGITPGVSPLVILFAWGAFAKRISRGGGSPFLNIAQVAGSGGMAITAGVIFTAPLLQILHATRAEPGLPELTALHAGLSAEGLADVDRTALLDQIQVTTAAIRAVTPPVDVFTLILLSICGAAIGFGFVGLSTRKFLTDPSLPAPEAQACRTMIDAAVAHPEARPKLLASLGLGSLLGILAPLTIAMGVAMHALRVGPSISNSDNSRGFTPDVHLAPIYIGIGGLLTLATAVLVFSGSVVHAVGGSLLASFDPGTGLYDAFPDNSMKWVGGAAMTVAVAWSLAKFAGLGKRKGAADADVDLEEEARILGIPAKTRALLWFSIFLGVVGIVAWLLVTDGPTPFVLAISPVLLAVAAVMVTLGALLSLQVGSSASPVSGTIFVTTLILCLVAVVMGRRSIEDVALLTPLLVAACVAVCTANDSSQDYKTMQFCGVPVRRGFLAQALGLLVGAVVVPTVLYVSHEAYLLGSPDLAAPQGTLFATLIEALLLESQLPLAPIGVGLALGVVAVGVEIYGDRRGVLLPSMALAVGIYLPPFLGFGMLIGALARRAGEGKGRRVPEGILAAAGLITGAALFELVFGIAILGVPGFDPGKSLWVVGEGYSLGGWVAGAGIAMLAGVIWWNARRRTSEH